MKYDPLKNVCLLVFQCQKCSQAKSVKSLRSMSWQWCRLVCVLVAKDGCILSKRKLKLSARITLATCFQISSKTAIACCPMDSSCSGTASQHTVHSAQCTGLAAGQLSRFHHKRPVASKFTNVSENKSVKFQIKIPNGCWESREKL